MNFALSSDLLALQTKVRHFIAEQIIPYEQDSRQTAHGPSAELRNELIAKARAAGLLTPHASVELGGLGLSHLAKAVVFEEAGYSPLGPIALNIHAPDEGNIHLMEIVANEEQKQRWLQPLVDGRIRSCFAMTEPDDGAGSDPSMLATTATPDGDGYRINGRKWFITGAEGASFAIIMAKMPDGSATMFLSDTNKPGFHLERMMDSLDSCFSGGHGVIALKDLYVPAEDVLGEIGKGFRYAQQRESFGRKLLEHQGVGFPLADNEMDLHTTRLTIQHCAWVLDQGEQGNVESSMAKVISSEAIWRVIDRSVQVLGGRGVTGESIVERIFRDARSFRIYDGPNEVHRMSLARKIFKRI